jgi:hypothetical protein
VCRLDWNNHQISWTIERFRAVLAEQEATIAAVAGQVPLQAAAFDGPLRAGFDVIGRYRTAERILTRRLGAKIGKPGQASAPIGKKLNAAANHCANIVLSQGRLSPATHDQRIDAECIVEAFPSAFLGVLLADPAAVAARRADRSDTFYCHLTQDGTLANLLKTLLPNRLLSVPLDSVTNHDDRAALICALTALCVAAGEFTAVGDADGWIVLPPRCFVREWAWQDLASNAENEVPGCLYQSPS